MNREKIFWILSCLGVIITFAMIGIHYHDIPDKVPMHFNGAGEVDRYGKKSEIFTLPFVSAILVIMILFMSRKLLKINPHKLGAKNEEQLAITKILMAQISLFCVLLIGWGVYQSMAVAVGRQDGLSNYFMAATFGGIFLLLIIYLIQLSRLSEKR